MALTTLTPSGEIAIPAEILKWFNLQPGDEIELAIASDGKVYLRPAPIDVRTLSGILHQAEREAVPLAEMEAAIAECAGESA